MKKFVIKATALAIGALVGGVAFASVNLDTGVTTGTFAKELSYATTPISGLKVVSTKLGFGVSAGQNRYIRVDLGGAKLAAAAAGANISVTPAFANSVVVAGGAVNDTYVIYQVTADTAGNAASDAVQITLPNFNVTNGNATSVTVTYTLYETAVAAVNNAAGTNLYTSTGALINFANSLTWTLTTNNTTADVSQSFKKFTAATTTGASTATANTSTARIGSFAYAVVTNKTADGVTNVTLADLVTAATKVVFAGNFGATATNGVYVDNNDACATVNAATVNTAKTSAEFTLGTTAKTANLCYVVNGTTAVPAQSISAALDLTAAAGSSAADVAAATIGTIDRDGTELQAPFATIHPDYLSRVVLTSTHSSDAVVDAFVIAEDGQTCSQASYQTTLKAGKMLVINTKDICPSLTSATRLAIRAVIAAPTSTIQGVYNVMNYDQTTGKTNSLISYPLLRPGTN